MEVEMSRPAGAAQWARLYRLYRGTFPRAERKPFAVIRKMQRRGKTDIWYCTRGGSFVGFAITINGPEHILVDYLAVAPSQRGGGVGSAALGALRRQYADKQLFLEIESVWEDVPDREARLRRKQFYLRNGFVPMNVMIWLFGVKMELLGTGSKLSYEQYRSFYSENYTPWAAEHISEAEHPDAGK